MKYTAALAQYAPVLGDVEHNLRRHAQLTEDAIAAGARLIVFPELSLTGYTVRDMNYDLCMRTDDPKLNPLRELSRHITIVLGAVEEADSYGVYNSAFIIEDGAVRSYRKVYPPDYGIFEEGRYFLPGTTAPALESTRCGRIGVLVCEDLWHVSLPLLQALDGATTLVVISASPTRLSPAGSAGMYEINSENHRALCRLLSVNMVFVNRSGYEDGVNFWGGSEIVDAFGSVRVAEPRSEETLLLGDVDDAWVRSARRASRHFLDENPHLLRRELTRIAGRP